MNNKSFKTQALAFFLFFGGFTLLSTQGIQAQATLNNNAEDSYYRAGLELFDKQKYGAAQKAFQEYIRLATLAGTQSGPGNLKVVDAQYYSGICALYLFNPDAEVQIDRFIAAHPQHPKAVLAYYELGQFYFTKKDYPRAIEYFGKIDTEQLSLEQTIDMKFKLGYAYFSAQDFEKAGPSFDDLKRSNHKYTAAANYYSGYINYKLGHYDEALKDLKKAEKDPAYQNEVPYMVANVYYKQQRYDELLAYTESIIGKPELQPTTTEKTKGAKKSGKVLPDKTLPGRAPSNKTPAKSSSGGKATGKPGVAGQGTTTSPDETPEETPNNGGATVKTIKNADELFLLTAEAYYRKGDYAKAAPYFKQYAATNKNARSKPAPEIQYRIAYAQYLTKDYAAAADAFKSIASGRDSIGQYSAYYLGMAYLQTNNKPFALQAFDQARKAKFNKQVQEESFFNYAKVLGDLDNNADAIVVLKEFLKAYPNSKYESEANELLGESYMNTNNYTEAITHIETLKTRTPRTDAAYQRVTYNQGVTNFNNDHLLEAITFFDKSLSSPREGDLVLAANFWKGEAYSVNRQYEDAISSYGAVFRKTDEGMKANTDDYALKSRYGIGYAYYNRKEYDKAAVHFREYISRSKSAVNKVGTSQLNYNDALIRLADCYYIQKDYNDAVATYDLAIAQNTVDKDYAYYQKGNILGIQGKDAEARQALDKVTQSPQSRYADGAQFQKAQITFEKGDYSGAVTQYSQLIESKPNSSFVPFALQRRAIAYSNLQQYDKAIADYQRVLNQYSTSKVANSALLGLQETLTNAGRTEEFNAALAKYKQANPQDNSLENVEFEAAKNLYFGEKYQKAVESLLSYLKTYPNNSLAYDAKFYLGESYYRLNDRTNAMKYHQAVIADNQSPNVGKAITRLAELEYASKNYPNAIRYYQTSLSRARNKKEQANAWNGLMESYYSLNRYDSVQYYADEIINKGGATVNAQNKALLYRGKSFYAQANYDQAIDEFLRTVNSAKDENGAEAQYLIGEALYKQTKYKESIDAMFELNQKFSSYEKWRGKGFLLIADNYVALDETFQAKATLNSIIERSPDKQAVEEAKTKLKALEEKQ
jgi:TolA-binding protein